ncbi:MAG: hypothetical protein CFE36_11310 [Sphingomonadaceae bacterium PASS1]|nr:MAG: hypothetical protein CFE36_11310 [Sphingomonadaceae bacterium PASS1]
MSEVTVIIRTADQTRKAEITMARTSVGGDIIQAAVDNWALPSDTDYTLVNTSSGKAISPSQSLSDDLVQNGQVLEVQPVLVAGC